MELPMKTIHKFLLVQNDTSPSLTDINFTYIVLEKRQHRPVYVEGGSEPPRS